MGVVYLARDERLDRPVALKLVAPRLSAEPGFRERFLIESRLAASLDHSHVVPIYEAGEVDGDLYLAMRYVEGTTLRDVLRQDTPLEPARALDICEQVAQALDGAHDRGLVHRDVKPANVLVADEGGREHCYLCDFGLARQRTQSGRRTVLRNGRLYGTGADQRRVDRRTSGSICARVRPLRVPDRTAALSTGPRRSDPLRAPERPTGVPPRPPGRSPREHRRRRRSRTRQGAGRALRDVPRAHRGGAHRPRPRRISRQPAGLLVAASGAVLGVAAAATVPAILLTRQRGGRGLAEALVPLTRRMRLRIDPAGRPRRAAHAVGRGPITFGEGSIWLARQGSEVVSRIDPAAPSLVDEIDATENGDPRALAVGEGHSGSSAVTGEAMFASTTSGRGAGRTSISASPRGSRCCRRCVLVGVHQIVRVDSWANGSPRRVDPGLQGKLVAAGEGAVWFSANKPLEVPSGSHVWRIDPATNTLGTPIDLEGTVADLAVGEGESGRSSSRTTSSAGSIR